MCQWATLGRRRRSCPRRNAIYDKAFESECLWHPCCLRDGCLRASRSEGGAGGVRSRRRPASRHWSSHLMKRSDLKNTQELVGIVISGMPRVPQPSVFTAYIWGPAPTVAEDAETKKS